MVFNFQINTNDPNIMYQNPLINLKKYLFELARKSARKAVAGILVYHRDCILHMYVFCKQYCSSGTVMGIIHAVCEWIEDGTAYV